MSRLLIAACDLCGTAIVEVVLWQQPTGATPKHPERDFGVLGPPFTRGQSAYPAKPPSQRQLRPQQLRPRGCLSIDNAQPVDLLAGIDSLTGDFVGQEPPNRVAGQRKRTIRLPVADRRKGLAGMLLDGHGSVEPPAWLFGDQRVYRLRGTPLRREVSQAHRRIKVGEDEMQRWRSRVAFFRSGGAFSTE